MGLSIKTCSCLKSSQEQNSEFRPILNTSSKNDNSMYQSNRRTPAMKSNNNKIFTFGKGRRPSNLSNQIKIQTVIRSFLFRKKFFNPERIKKYREDDENIIKQKRFELIPKELLDKDNLIKKEFNDDFLDKLENNKNNNGPKLKKVKTNCLVTKYSLYKGEQSLDGKFNGYGELYFKEGKKYEGNFIDGKLNGYGRFINLSGNDYEGMFKDDKFQDGKGKIINFGENGEKIVYEGDIKDMAREGNGIEKTKDHTYIGQFKNDLKNGKGKIIFSGGDEYYEGDFLNNKQTGKGFYKWKDGNTYEGDFVDGKMHGRGLYRWANGDEYEGEFVNNIREGQGERRWKNGKKSQGYFKNGKQHGKGFIYYNGNKQEVEFNNGKIVKKDNNTKSQTTLTLGGI